MNHILKCHRTVKIDLVKGKGCTLYDVHGKRYTDFEAGSWAVALGYNHPRIHRVMREQMERVIHLGCPYPNALAEKAAVQVLDTLAYPGGKCIFLSSGSEAVEFGVQSAKRLTGRPLLLALADSYLAAYGSAGRKSPEEWALFDWHGCITCSHPDACDAGCSRLEEIPFERVGGFVFEVGGSPNRIKFPPRSLIQTLANRVKRRCGLVLANEVTSGLGRTGAWYGFQHYGLQPDIVALGKGLGNGYPVSAVAMTGAIADGLENSAFQYAQSHENDPLGCAIAREVIGVMREDELVERSERVGAYFLRELERLAERHAAIKEVRGRGLLIGIEFARTNEHSANSARVYRKLLERGFLVGYTLTAHLFRLSPALTIDEREIARFLENLDHILESCDDRV